MFVGTAHKKNTRIKNVALHGKMCYTDFATQLNKPCESKRAHFFDKNEVSLFRALYRLMSFEKLCCSSGDTHFLCVALRLRTFCLRVFLLILAESI